MSTLMVVSAAVIVALLARNLYQRFAADHIQRLMKARISSSRLVTRAALLDDGHETPVSLALGVRALYYEGADLQASLDLEWIEEVAYDTDGATNILRLQCYGQVYQFTLPQDAVAQWKLLMPPTHTVATPEQSRADDDGWPSLTPAKSTAS